MIRKKIAVEFLKHGMYVAELDRPWLETDFLFQGFVIYTDDEIEDLRKVCKYVYIDIEKGRDSDKAEFVSGVGGQEQPENARDNVIQLERSIGAAAEIRSKVRECIKDVFNDVLSDRQPDIPRTREAVRELVRSIVGHPGAQLCLTQMTEKDGYTVQHSLNVCVLTIAFCVHIGVDKDSLEQVGLGALLHDVGKLKMPREILEKPDKLTGEEFQLMKTHPEEGWKILQEMDDIPAVAMDIAFSHHERVAGHGYPRGLKKEDISLWSKIVAIVDVYDAVTSDRSYCDGMSPTSALTNMYRSNAHDYDPELLEKFIQFAGIYPVGTLVELTSGEVGVVLSVDQDHRLKPRVLLLLDRDKNPYYPSRYVNLAMMNYDLHQGEYSIQAALSPNTYDIDIRNYLPGLTA